jgi:hypothetical protein
MKDHLPLLERPTPGDREQLTDVVLRQTDEHRELHGFAVCVTGVTFATS